MRQRNEERNVYWSICKMGANQWNLNFKLEMIRFGILFGELLYSFILNGKTPFFGCQ